MHRDIERAGDSGESPVEPTRAKGLDGKSRPARRPQVPARDTFEDYCRDRWGFSKVRATQMISAAQTVTMVTTGGLPAPENERQARELARVPEAERAEVWQQALARTDGKPTAAAIRETYAPRPAEPAEGLLETGEGKPAASANCRYG